jgi:glucose-6-phosphate isomerase
VYGEAYRSQVIVIGDHDSALVLRAKKEKILAFTLPKSIGGRYSVFSAVGIVPLTLLGVDVADLRKGAAAGVTHNEIEISAESASVLAYGAGHGVRVVNYFTFSRRLVTVGYWYRQLLAESIGKPRTKSKKLFTMQLLPTVSSSIDLHSVAQLYLGGYTGVYTKFVQASSENLSQTVRDSWVTTVVPSVHQKSLRDVKDAITTGVLNAYTEAGLPHHITYVDALTAFEVGRILAQTMTEVMCLCALFNVDAFDQPNVESYKNHTREALAT